MYKKIIRLFLIMIVMNTTWVMGKEVVDRQVKKDLSLIELKSQPVIVG